MLATDYYWFSYFFACCKYGYRNKKQITLFLFVCDMYLVLVCIYWFSVILVDGVYNYNVNGTSTLNHWKLPNVTERYWYCIWTIIWESLGIIIFFSIWIILINASRINPIYILICPEQKVFRWLSTWWRLYSHRSKIVCFVVQYS